VLLFWFQSLLVFFLIRKFLLDQLIQLFYLSRCLLHHISWLLLAWKERCFHPFFSSKYPFVLLLDFFAMLQGFLVSHLYFYLQYDHKMIFLLFLLLYILVPLHMSHYNQRELLLL